MARLFIRYAGHEEQIFNRDPTPPRADMLLAAVECCIRSPRPIPLTEQYEIAETTADGRKVVLSGDFGGAFDALDEQRRVDLLMNHLDAAHPEGLPQVVSELLKRNEC